MQLVVPLAGADFISSSGVVKALIDFQGEPLLKRLLDSRPWSSCLENITFILLDSVESRIFVDSYLFRWYPECRVVYLSSATQGAAFSVLTGLGLASNLDSPLIVDLADISYKSNLDISSKFSLFPNCGGIALTFDSSKSCYSYLRLDEQGSFCEAVEKRVISTHASAGTYIYKDSATYLKALAHSIENSESQVFNGLYYVCPLFNGIAAQGLEVLLEPVSDVIDIKDESFAMTHSQPGDQSST